MAEGGIIGQVVDLFRVALNVVQFFEWFMVLPEWVLLVLLGQALLLDHNGRSMHQEYTVGIVNFLLAW